VEQLRNVRLPRVGIAQFGDAVSGPSEAGQALRERIKLAIQTAQDSEGRLLYAIPPGVAGMYADAVMRVFTERPYPHEDV
jgi:hypothetical protein